MASASSATTGAQRSEASHVDAHLLHVARRLTYGPTPEILTPLRDTGADAWLDAQLDPASIDDVECDRRLWALTGLGIDVGRAAPGVGSTLDGLGATPVVDGASELLATAAMSLDELEAALLPLDRSRIDRAISELRLATVVRATYSRRQVLEQMVDLWWNHFNVWPGKHPLVAAMTVAADRDVIRPHALGRFADLLQASAASPAMLTFLDNWLNRAGEPNENYGRELLELHTVGVESGFTEHDVADASRVFTGWTIDGVRGGFRFEPEWHDPGPKQVLGWSTPGARGAAGVDEGRSLLDHLAHHPSTARHVATKLARRFVADDPPAALVASAADVYVAHGTATVPVLHHIVASDEFRSSAGTKVRRPFDFFVAALRSLGADVGDPIGPSTAAGHSIDHTLERLGQRPFDAQSPAGYPEAADSWLGAGLLPHWSVAHELARNALAGIAVDVAQLAGGASAGGAVCDAVLVRLHGTTQPDRRAALMEGLELGEQEPVDSRQLTELVGLALCAAEGQQR